MVLQPDTDLIVEEAASDSSNSFTSESKDIVIHDSSEESQDGGNVISPKDNREHTMDQNLSIDKEFDAQLNNTIFTIEKTSSAAEPLRNISQPAIANLTQPDKSSDHVVTQTTLR